MVLCYTMVELAWPWLTIRKNHSAVSVKGSLKNNFAELALRFAPDLVANN